MNSLNDLDCPQYVNFETEFLNDKLSDDDVPKDPEDSPSSPSIKEERGTENMDVEDENSYLQDNQNTSGSILKLSDSYLSNNSCLESVESVASASFLTNDFPVHRPKNLSLPENVPKASTKINETTKVQPFHFMESKKRKRENAENEYIPLAEQIIAFHKKTPQRFHTTGSKAFEPLDHWSPPVVIPKSPKLHAAKRHRGVNVLSREEREQNELEEIKRYKFRARPVNQSILKQPKVHTVEKKLATKPHNVHLRTAQRAVEVHAKKKVDEKPYEFHARPVPKAVLNGCTGIKQKLSLPVTEAKTPNFALKKRAEKWKSENKLNATTLESQQFKALPVPASSAPFAVKREKKHTEIQPFSFDSKDRERIIRKEQKIMQEIEKETAVYVFKAQPMPSPAPSSLPEVEKKPTTCPNPFNFHLEGRSSKHNSFNLSLDQIRPIFKAQPATVLEKPPFVPEKLDRNPVEVKEFHLYTDIRASERQKLKEINDLKEQEKQQALLNLKLLQEKEEQKEILRLRQEAVHKANPIRHYKPVEIKPSDKLPTEPVSPKFKTKERLQMRH